MELKRIRWVLFRRYYPLLLDASAIVLAALSVFDMLQMFLKLQESHDLPKRTGSAPVIFAISELLLASPFLSSNLSKTFKSMQVRRAA